MFINLSYSLPNFIFKILSILKKWRLETILHGVHIVNIVSFNVNRVCFKSLFFFHYNAKRISFFKVNRDAHCPYPTYRQVWQSLVSQTVIISTVFRRYNSSTKLFIFFMFYKRTCPTFSTDSTMINKQVSLYTCSIKCNIGKKKYWNEWINLPFILFSKLSSLLLSVFWHCLR